MSVRSAGHFNRPPHGTLLCATLVLLLVCLWGGGGKCFTAKILEATSKSEPRDSPPCGLSTSLRPASGLLSGLLTLVGCTPVTPDASSTLMVYLWGILWCIYGVSYGVSMGYLMVYLWGILWCIYGCVCCCCCCCFLFWYIGIFFLVSSIGLFWFPLSVSFRSSSFVLVSSLACV